MLINLHRLENARMYSFISHLIKKKVFGHKKSEKSTRIFLNTDFGMEKSPLTGNTYIYQQKNSQSL
jgi:hypothetical protein